ncbi:hypothetical protein ACQPXM_08690 [Kribbella sp. CA-253562]|uniref:hypothetical protein n=1 Tax=Kribbella sp. CA-253562 TaxID=3239942 RepID=UPI003D936352
MRKLIRLLTGVLAAVVLVAAGSIPSANASETAWSAPQITYYYPGCAAGQTTIDVYSGPYRGALLCGTYMTNVYWTSGSVTRQHTFVISPGRSAWNAVHQYSDAGTIAATGWKSLGGANLTGAINVVYAPNPGTINLEGNTTTGGHFCNQLRNNAWSGWFGC